MLIPEYCYGVEVEVVDRKTRSRSTVIKDCNKIVNGKCTAYADPCKKMGLARGGFLGCAFSPAEGPEAEKLHVRVGQQKQKKRR